MNTVTLDMDYERFTDLFGFSPEKTNSELFNKAVWIKVGDNEAKMKPIYYSEDYYSDGRKHKVRVALEPWVDVENIHILDVLAQLPQVTRAVYGYDKQNKPNEYCVWSEVGHTISLMAWVETDAHLRERILGGAK